MNTTPTTPTEAVTAALAAHPESSAAELAEAAGTGAVTEGVPTTHDEGSAPRLHKGELSTLVLDFLKAHRGDAIGPSAIGKALGRSSGAVANACQRLEASGSLRLASDSLRRYQIADA